MLAAVLAAGALLAPAPASARKSPKKAIWGPHQVGSLSQFPVYRRLGVGIYQMTLHWNEVALRRPRRPTNRHDRAYVWPPEIDYAIGEAADARIRIALTVLGTPRWANGGQSRRFAPTRLKDFQDFLTAAARRYPTVRLWRIWDHPSVRASFGPLTPHVNGQPYTRRHAAAPRRYARMLDAAYVALKRERRTNLVIGGNTTTSGDISPLHWIRSMRLPNGRRPRLDLYGHDPFSTRPPDLALPPLGGGHADFADLDTLSLWIDRYLGPTSRGRRRIFVSRYSVPSDHPPRGSTFFVDRETQARWLSDALRQIMPWPRIYAFGWFGLYDEPPTPQRDESNHGLLEWQGNAKPAYVAYRDT
jgi:hypothetical protein